MTNILLHRSLSNSLYKIILIAKMSHIFSESIIKDIERPHLYSYHRSLQFPLYLNWNCSISWWNSFAKYYYFWKLFSSLRHLPIYFIDLCLEIWEKKEFYEVMTLSYNLPLTPRQCTLVWWDNLILIDWEQIASPIVWWRVGGWCRRAAWSAGWLRPRWWKTLKDNKSFKGTIKNFFRFLRRISKLGHILKRAMFLDYWIQAKNRQKSEKSVLAGLPKWVPRCYPVSRLAR